MSSIGGGCTGVLSGGCRRLSEPLNLRVKDVDFAKSRLYIHDAKGGKDRVVRLPDSVMTDLRDQLRRARLIHEIDLAARVPCRCRTASATSTSTPP